MRGSILRRKSGGWQATVDLGPDPLTGKRRRTSKTFPTKAEAEDALPEMLAAARARTPAPRHATVGDLLDRWLEACELDKSPNTMIGYREKVRNHLAALRDLPLTRLTRPRIAEHYRALRRAGLSASSVRKVHACLSGALNMGVDEGWLPSNPCPKPPPLVREERELVDVADLVKVWKECSQNMRELVWLAIATGRRRSELCGLRWPDLDGPRYSFRRAIDNHGNLIPPGRRKSKPATITVDPLTVAIFDARRERAASDAEACKASLDDAYVFGEPGWAGPLHPAKVTQRWRDACKRAEVKIRFHDLRHFSTSMLVAAGLDPKVIADRNGHTVEVMLRTYTHSTGAADERAARVMGALLAAQFPLDAPAPRRRPRSRG